MNKTYQEQYERGCEEISIEEAAYRLGRKPDTVKAWIKGKHVPWGQYIPPEKGSANGQWIIRRKAFEAWLNGGQPNILAQLIIDTPEAFEALCRVAVNRVTAR